jgi:hypothetical protein
MDPREHWRAVYEAKRPDEVSWFQALPEPSLAALERHGIGAEASLIDVGGGASGLAGELAALGWRDVTVLDIAASAIGEAKGRLVDTSEAIIWIDADILHWRPSRTFDVWHDRALFHFLTEPAERELYLGALRAGTHDDSLVILATFALDGPEQCSGLPVRRYDAEAMAAELGEEFTLVEAWRQAHVTPWGAEQRFQWAAFRRM